MARYLDLMLCIFPFEAELYNQSDCAPSSSGHPMIESLAARRVAGTRDVKPDRPVPRKPSP
jgi:lipid-A-disaccharide synthase